MQKIEINEISTLTTEQRKNLIKMTNNAFGMDQYSSMSVILDNEDLYINLKTRGEETDVRLRPEAWLAVLGKLGL